MAVSQGSPLPGDIRFVPGQGSAEKLTDSERDAALRAIDALAADLKIAPTEILVDTIRAVDWPDSSLGCPKPGVAYLQVVKPGHKVTLRAKDQIFVVHEAGNQAAVCRNSKAFGALATDRELAFGPEIIAARDDLAKRLGVPAKDIRPLAGLQQTFPDAALGCPEPGKMYAQGQVAGWVLTLRHKERDYTYHTDGKRTIPCPPISVE
jgi:hypothetical protein